MNNLFKYILVTISIAFSSHAFACTAINTVPAAINSPGDYCLSNDVTQPAGTSGTSILIQSKDVTLDLNGHTLNCSSNPYGIYITSIVSNVRLRNGSIRNCTFSVAVNNCTACEIHNLTVIDGGGVNTTNGSGIVIRNNSFVNSTPDKDAMTLRSNGNLVHDNFISGYRAGISTTGNHNIVRNNSINNCSQSAIYAKFPITFMNNLTSGCTTPFLGAGITGGVNAGGNF